MDTSGFDSGSGLGQDADQDGWYADADCDDDDSTVHPTAHEQCLNGKDDDCDGTVDACVLPLEAAVTKTLETDIDGAPATQALVFDDTSSEARFWVCTGGEVGLGKSGSVSAFEAAVGSAATLFGNVDSSIIEGMAAARDLNGDGNTDVLVTGSDDQEQDAYAWIWLGPISGAHDLSDSDSVAWGPGIEYFASPELVDLNADGAVDVVMGNGLGNWIVYGPLSATVEIEDSPHVFPAVDHTYRMVARDMDGDGVEDLAIGEAGSGDTSVGAVDVFRGPYSGAIASEYADHRWETDSTAYALATCDCDSDGALDLIVGSGSAYHSRIDRVRIDSVGETIADVSAGTIYGQPETDLVGFGLAARDLNHDSIDDVILGTVRTNGNDPIQDGQLAVAIGPVDGVVEEADASSLTVIGAENSRMGWSVGAGDLDRDGEIEVAVRSLLWNGSAFTGSAVHVLTPETIVGP